MDNEKDFYEYMRSGMQKIIGEKGRVELIQVRRNNGVTLEGLIVKSEEKNISPAIYLNRFYEEYRGGKLPEDILQEIYESYIYYADRSGLDVRQVSDYESMKKNIFFKLVNFERNKEYLPEVPYVRFLNLAVIFYALVPSFEEKTWQNASFQIRDEHLKMWNVDIGDIYRDALYNCPDIFCARIYGMEELLLNMMQENLCGSGAEEKRKEYEQLKSEVLERGENITSKIYVLTNEQRLFGAACLLYKNVLHSFAETINRNFYILPSSVHEVLLVPEEENMAETELSSMVWEINRNELDEEDILSDEVYYYKKETDFICLLK